MENEICIGYEDDVPIFVRRDSAEGKMAIAIEAKARELAAEKIGSKDPTGSNLPRELWCQCIPAARAAVAGTR